MKPAHGGVRDLKAWQKGISLVEDCYRVSAILPVEERFGLTSQIRRAAASFPANIAEGFGRWNPREFSRFLAIASGSLRELETHLVIACRLRLLSSAASESLFPKIEEMARMIYGMRTALSAQLGSSNSDGSSTLARRNSHPKGTANGTTFRAH